MTATRPIAPFVRTLTMDICAGVAKASWTSHRTSPQNQADCASLWTTNAPKAPMTVRRWVEFARTHRIPIHVVVHSTISTSRSTARTGLVESVNH
uniref:Transposase n=1 Tax=Acrobeloides nanus TaxID=290746 RepID=A0A914DC49_9BILA